MLEGSDIFFVISGRFGGPEEGLDKLGDENGNVFVGADRFFVISGRSGGPEAFLVC